MMTIMRSVCGWLCSADYSTTYTMAGEEGTSTVRRELDRFEYDRPELWENFKAEMLLLWTGKGLLSFAESDMLNTGAPVDRTKRQLAGVETREARKQRLQAESKAEENESDEVKKTREENRRKDAQALLLLRRHICPVSKSYIAGAMSTFQAWEILTTEVEQRITAEVVDYEKEMSRTKLREYDTMTLYLKAMEDIRKRLLLGSQNIDPKNFVLRVLDGIGDEYDAQKAHIRLMNDMGQAIPYSAVRPMLIAAAKDKGAKRDGTKGASANGWKRRGRRSNAGDTDIGEDEEATALANRVVNMLKRGQTRARGAGGGNSDSHGRPRGVCFGFRDTGSCRWGDTCRWAHVRSSVPQWGKGGPFRGPGPNNGTNGHRGTDNARTATAFTMAVEAEVQRALSQLVANTRGHGAPTDSDSVVSWRNGQGWTTDGKPDDGKHVSFQE